MVVFIKLPTVPKWVVVKLGVVELALGMHEELVEIVKFVVVVVGGVVVW